MTVRVRFAPSPTGHLHVGNVRTALFNWLYARRQNGKFILRIEDTDTERSTKESENIIYDDLNWLGLDWDEGPDCGGDAGPYRQSERLNIYRKYTDQLIQGGFAYYCFCTPEELEAQRKKAIDEKRPPRYDRRCLKLSDEEVEKRLGEGMPASVRFKVPDDTSVFWYDVVKGKTEIPSEVIGDQIIMRANGIPRYNFAVAIDDHLMEISHVIRGDDHVPNTPLQLLIYRAFGWKEPKFAHLSMIVGTDRARLSKRHGATSINQFREDGYLPEALLNYLALLGWSPGDDKEKMTTRELIDKFSLKRVSSSAAVFDRDKLNWLNSSYLHRKNPAGLAQLIVPILKRKGLIPEKEDEDMISWLKDLSSAVRTNLTTLNDINDLVSPLFNFDAESIITDNELKEMLDDEGTIELLNTLKNQMKKHPIKTAEDYREVMLSVMKETDRKGKNLFHPVRIALTGRLSGLELEQLIPLIETGSKLDLPKKILSSVERIDQIIKVLSKQA